MNRISLFLTGQLVNVLILCLPMRFTHPAAKDGPQGLAS